MLAGITWSEMTPFSSKTFSQRTIVLIREVVISFLYPLQRTDAKHVPARYLNVFTELSMAPTCPSSPKISFTESIKVSLQINVKKLTLI